MLINCKNRDTAWGQAPIQNLLIYNKHSFFFIFLFPYIIFINPFFIFFFKDKSISKTIYNYYKFIWLSDYILLFVYLFLFQPVINIFLLSICLFFRCFFISLVLIDLFFRLFYRS